MTDRPAWVQALLCRDLTPTEYRVWSYLSWRQGNNGHAWPSQATIAADLGLTTRAVRGIVRRLTDKGWLGVEWPGGPGRGHPCRYSVRCPQNRNGDSSVDEHKTGTLVPLLSEKNRNDSSSFGDENRNAGSAKRGRAVPPNTIQGTLPTKKKSGDACKRIMFDRQKGEFIGISGRLDAWQRAYPDVDVPRELHKAAAWAAANPDRAKKNWSRFIVNWLSTAEKDMRNGRTQGQHNRTHRPSFSEQVSAVGEVVEV